MSQTRNLLPADVWMLQLFSSKTACTGGVVRRSSRDVERIVGRTQFLAELQRRGFHVVENSGQFVIFCNNAPVTLIC